MEKREANGRGEKREVFIEWRMENGEMRGER